MNSFFSYLDSWITIKYSNLYPEADSAFFYPTANLPFFLTNRTQILLEQQYDQLNNFCSRAPTQLRMAI